MVVVVALEAAGREGAAVAEEAAASFMLPAPSEGISARGFYRGLDFKSKAGVGGVG